MHDPRSGMWFYRYVADNDSDQLGADGRYHVYMSVSLGDIALGWQEQGSTEELISHPYILAWDYGLNPSEVFPINLLSGNPGTPSPVREPRGRSLGQGRRGLVVRVRDGQTYLKAGWFTINGRDYQFGPSGLHGDRFPQAHQRGVGVRRLRGRPRGWLGAPTVVSGTTSTRPPRSWPPAGWPRGAPGTTLTGLRRDGHRVGERRRYLVLPERLRTDGDRVDQGSRHLVLPVPVRRDGHGHARDQRAHLRV